MNEYDIERRLVEGVEELGGLCLKLHLDGKRGFPDRTVILNSWIGWVELKRRGGRLSRQQKEWLAELDEQGFEAVCLTGIDEVEDYLEQLKFVANTETR